MPLRKKTLRKMPPTARALAKLIAEQESSTRRLKNLLQKIISLEIQSEAFVNMSAATRKDD